MKSILYCRNFISIVILFTLYSAFMNTAYSQSCSGNKINISLQNITSLNTKSIEYDVYVTNIGSTSLSLAAIQGAVIHDEHLIQNGSNIEFEVITQPSETGNFPTLNNLIIRYSDATNQMRWTQNPVALSSGKTIFLSPNKRMKFARFRLTSSLPLAPNLISKLTPQLVPAKGITTVLATVYCNNSTNSIGLRSTIDDQKGGELNEDFKVIGTPNPFLNYFMIDVRSSSLETIHIKVYDILGKLIESKSSNLYEIENKEIGTNYKSGIYNIIVSQGDNSQSLRMIKQ